MCSFLLGLPPSRLLLKVKLVSFQSSQPALLTSNTHRTPGLGGQGSGGLGMDLGPPVPGSLLVASLAR